MLNFTGFDKSDGLLLESSYDAIKGKDQLEIITDETEKQKIFRQTIDNLKMPGNGSFSFKNLFKLTSTKGCFYIAQCLIDFGFPPGRRGMQTFDRQYHYQIIGIANLTIDLGISNLRTENTLDKIIGRFFNSDINFNGTEKFNDKYYLVSNNKEAILQYFDKRFLNGISNHDDVLLTTNAEQMFISFDAPLKTDQSRIVEDILSNFRWLADH